MSDGQGESGRVRAQSAEEPPFVGYHIFRRPNSRAEVSGAQATAVSSPPNPQSTNCSFRHQENARILSPLWESLYYDYANLIFLEQSSGP